MGEGPFIVESRANVSAVSLPGVSRWAGIQT